MIVELAAKSLRNRKLTAALTIVSIALAVALMLAVDRLRTQAREGFASTIAGTDLVVGARTSPVHLLLLSVFRLGDATQNLRWVTYRALASRDEVAWAIPLSLGDSHRGYRVMGTTTAYFEHFRYARDRALEIVAGRRFEHLRDAVLGAEVAQALGYGLGQSIVVAHGADDVGLARHSDRPFEVVGILAPTGTPVDRTIHVTLEGFDALHESGVAESAHDPLVAARNAARAHAVPAEAGGGNAAAVASDAHRPITAILVGLKARAAALALQRELNEYAGEPLTAILPGVTLLDVWTIATTAENALFAVASLVFVVGLAGMLVALLTSLSERRREMAVLRSVGARPAQIFGLIVGEAALLTLTGIAFGYIALAVGLRVASPWLAAHLGFAIDGGAGSAREYAIAAGALVAGVAIGFVPAYRIYRYSLADGLTIRV